MISVSLCMIVKNEEDVLGRCLKSAAALVDEIIVVDTGSTDRTRETASKFTDQIFDFPWRDDFAAARNESFSHASMDYCLWLDADDILLEADQAAFLALKETLDPAVAVVMAPITPASIQTAVSPSPTTGSGSSKTTPECAGREPSTRQSPL